jgi:hypothetical protein
MAVKHALKPADVFLWQRELAVRSSFFVVTLCGICVGFSLPAMSAEIDTILNHENMQLGVSARPVALTDDLSFLRRASIDFIARIPTNVEIQEFMSWPVSERRALLLDKLMAESRFTDRWTVFFSDMLRLRSSSPGGSALIAYVHNAINEGMPYDLLVRRLIATNGKVNVTPEVGFILGDNADPLAMASVTSQVFLGVRMGCAQCHDHPFDVWTREDFYGLAAYFGKTRRVETRFTRVVYTTEANQSSVLWPPEDEAESKDRTAMTPRFPLGLDTDSGLPFVVRFEALRRRIADIVAREEARADEVDLDRLVDLAAARADLAIRGELPDATTAEAKRDIRKIDIQESLYRSSELREQLAEFVTSPRNRYFSRAIVNRVWKELVGRGFVEPVDDFRPDNLPQHPRVMEYLAEEFVAQGYDLRWLIREIALSDVYGRGHAPDAAEHVDREELEANFLATPRRRMIGEALYDSIVTAGHLFETKHLEGTNIKVVQETIRVPKQVDKEDVADGATTIDLSGLQSETASMAMTASNPINANGGYSLEDAIELDFAALLDQKDDDLVLDKMAIVSAEELEAQRLAMTRPRVNVEYITKVITRSYDDNPRFNSSLRMASPAPAGHFLRVFGQPERAQLGDFRDDSASMRQALMMLNGRLTNESARVGKLEPIYELLVGKRGNLDRAIHFAYLEILTRVPSEEEIIESREIVGQDVLAGMEDLRWVLLNCNEFRFLP